MSSLHTRRAVGQDLAGIAAPRGIEHWRSGRSPADRRREDERLYSLIQTAKANGIEPYRYLRYLFTKLPLAKSREDYLALTPAHLDQADFHKHAL